MENETMNQWRTSPQAEPVGDIPCKNAHAINGFTPGPDDQQYTGQVCDCKRILFNWQYCNCRNGMMLKQLPNPNY